jgi:hypothetical protein
VGKGWETKVKEREGGGLDIFIQQSIFQRTNLNINDVIRRWDLWGVIKS